MALGKLEFTRPEEEESFRHACSAEDYYSALRAVDEHIRSRLKYVPLSLEVTEALDEVRRFMREFIPEVFA